MAIPGVTGATARTVCRPPAPAHRVQCTKPQLQSPRPRSPVSFLVRVPSASPLKLCRAFLREEVPPLALVPASLATASCCLLRHRAASPPIVCFVALPACCHPSPSFPSSPLVNRTKGQMCCPCRCHPASSPPVNPEIGPKPHTCSRSCASTQLGGA